jgi:hypothetical protein
MVHEYTATPIACASLERAAPPEINTDFSDHLLDPYQATLGQHSVPVVLTSETRP